MVLLSLFCNYLPFAVALNTRKTIIIVIALIAESLVLMSSKSIKFTYSVESSSLLIFLLYLLIYHLLTTPSIISDDVLIPLSLILAYFIFSNINKKELFVTLSIFTYSSIILSLELIIYYIFQLKGASLLGSYDNITGISHYLSLTFPMIFMVLQSKLFRLLSCVIVFLAIIISASRISIIATIIILLLRYNKINNTIRYILCGGGILSLIIFLSSFNLNSVIGRILIWSIALNLFYQVPIFGGGARYFSSSYMTFQSDYFAQHIHSNFSLLADNIFHPFNEYILFLDNYGLFGLLILLPVIRSLLSLHNDAKYCIIAFLIISIASYPTHYLINLYIVILCYAILCKTAKSTHQLRFLHSRFTLFVTTILTSIILFYNARFEYKWYDLLTKINTSKTSVIEKEYANLYSLWNGDSMFLYNYGMTLHRHHQFNRSNDILTECCNYYNDYDIQVTLGDNYKELKEYERAESCYIMAANMIPNRFLPYHKLLKIYIENGETAKGLWTAHTIINKEVKKPSQFIARVKESAQEYIESTATQ